MNQASQEADRLLTAVRAEETPNTANLRRLRRAASRRLRDADANVVLAVAKTLIANDRRWLGYELIHWDSAAVANFLERHDQAIAPRVRREVRHKLETGLKNP